MRTHSCRSVGRSILCKCRTKFYWQWNTRLLVNYFSHCTHMADEYAAVSNIILTCIAWRLNIFSDYLYPKQNQCCRLVEIIISLYVVWVYRLLFVSSIEEPIMRLVRDLVTCSPIVSCVLVYKLSCAVNTRRAPHAWLLRRESGHRVIVRSHLRRSLICVAQSAVIVNEREIITYRSVFVITWLEYDGFSGTKCITTDVRKVIRWRLQMTDRLIPAYNVS